MTIEIFLVDLRVNKFKGIDFMGRNILKTFLFKWLLDCEFLLFEANEDLFLFGWIEPNRVTLWLKMGSSNKSSCDDEELPAKYLLFYRSF